MIVILDKNLQRLGHKLQLSLFKWVRQLGGDQNRAQVSSAAESVLGTFLTGYGTEART